MIPGRAVVNLYARLPRKNKNKTITCIIILKYSFTYGIIAHCILHTCARRVFFRKFASSCLPACLRTRVVSRSFLCVYVAHNILIHLYIYMHDTRLQVYYYNYLSTDIIYSGTTRFGFDKWPTLAFVLLADGYRVFTYIYIL